MTKYFCLTCLKSRISIYGHNVTPKELTPAEVTHHEDNFPSHAIRPVEAKDQKTEIQKAGADFE